MERRSSLITVKDLRARFARVLVQPIEITGEVSKGGIVIPDNAGQDKPRFGKVLSVGEGRWLQLPDGQEILVPLKTQVGAHVAFGKYAGQAMRMEGDRIVLIMEEAEILCEVDNFPDDVLPEPEYVDAGSMPVDEATQAQ